MAAANAATSGGVLGCFNAAFQRPTGPGVSSVKDIVVQASGAGECSCAPFLGAQGTHETPYRKVQQRFLGLPVSLIGARLSISLRKPEAVDHVGGYFDHNPFSRASCKKKAFEFYLPGACTRWSDRCSLYKGTTKRRLSRLTIRASTGRDSSSVSTSQTDEDSQSSSTDGTTEFVKTVRLEPALSLAEAVEQLQKAISYEDNAVDGHFVAPRPMAVLRYEVPLPPTVDALRWLRSQAPSPELVPRIYYSPRVPRGGDGGPGNSRNLQVDASSASGIDGGGVGSVAGVGSALTVTGVGPFGWQEWASIRAYLSPTSPFVRAYGGTRFNDKETPSAEWAAFGSHHFVFPQVELREGTSGALLACTVIWGGPAPGAPSRGYAFAAAREAMAQVVMARRTTLEMSETVDPLVILECLQERDPSAYQFLIQLPSGQAFLGSTPERLFVRHGAAVASEAVAGTRPRGVPTNTPMDQKIAYEILLSEKENREFEIVRNDIHRHMQVACDEVEVEVPKKLIKQATVQHLYGRLNGVLRSDAQEFAMLSKLHPTPAVCGHPQDRARDAISANEPFDRGMYAGPMGWLGGDGCEFAVAIRSALTNSADDEFYDVGLGSDASRSNGLLNARNRTESDSTAADFGGHDPTENEEATGRQGGESTSGRSDESDGRPYRSSGRTKPRKRPTNLRPLNPSAVLFPPENGNGSASVPGLGLDSQPNGKSTQGGESSRRERQAKDFKYYTGTHFRPGKKISLFAGVGIVEGADPLAEWRELNLKTSQFERILSPLPPLSEAPNVNALWARLIIEECCRLGVTYFCIAPGSRSSPLAAAAAANPRARCISCIDERSLAFHALGYGRGRNEPAAVITSSGTAVSNLMPAVVEAHQDCVPLLLLTADRPPELRDTGANQTIDQVKHFGSFVRYHSDLPPPDAAIPARMALTIVDQAVYRCTGSPAGPVHLNLAFREPLVPLQKPFQDGVLQGLDRWENSSTPYTSYVRTPSSGRGWADDLSEILELLRGAKKGLIVVGGRGVGRDGAWAILKLAEALGWPIVADAVSGLRIPRSRSPAETPKPPIVYHFDHILLGAQSDHIRSLLAPDVVLQLGSRVTSKRTATFLDGLPLQGHVLVDSHPFRHDPSHMLSHRVEMPVAHFVVTALETLAASSAFASSDEGSFWGVEKGPKQAISEYGRILVELSEAVGREIGTCLEEEEELSEPHVARIVAGSVAAEQALFLGNSMAIRDVDMYAEDFLSGIPHDGTGPPGYGAVSDPGASIGPAGLGPSVAANRGASGIDGVLSTATGFAAGLGRPVTLLVGDVSFLHDTNGLLLVNNRPGQPPVITVVVNNSGGGIFSLLPNVDTIPGSHFTQYWSTPHDVFLDKLCSGHRVKYTLARSRRELEAALAFAWRRRMSWVIEVQTDIDDNVAHHRTLQDAAKRTVERALARDHPGRPSLLGSLFQGTRQITDVRISKYQVQLSAPPTTKSRETQGPQTRSGLLVGIELQSGAVGTGEIAPLDGLHRETLEEAEEQFRGLRGALIGRSLPGTLPLLGGALATWLQREAGINAPALFPSVRFGLETALLTAFADNVGMSLSELLLGGPRPPIGENRTSRVLPPGSSQGPLVCALLASEGSPEEAAEEANAAVTRGFCTLKLKVARRASPAEDAAAVAAVRAAVGPDIVLRADANRRWTLEQATQFGLAVKKLGLQYVEEPLDNPCDLPEFYERTGVAIALDESVDEGLVGRTQTDLQLGAAQGVVALVIKPSRVGGTEAAASLARWAAQRGILAVISSAFESSVGLSAHSEVAHFVDESRRHAEVIAATNAANPEAADAADQTSNLKPPAEPFSIAIRSAFEMSGVPVDGNPEVRTFLEKLEREEKRERRKKERVLERVRLKEMGGQRVVHGLGTFEWLATDTVLENGFNLIHGKQASSTCAEMRSGVAGSRPEQDRGLEVDMRAVENLLVDPVFNPDAVPRFRTANGHKEFGWERFGTAPEVHINSYTGWGRAEPTTIEGADGEPLCQYRPFRASIRTGSIRMKVPMVEVTDARRSGEAPDGGPTSLPLVLFLHGFLGDLRDCLPVMTPLLGSAQLFALNIPGHRMKTLEPSGPSEAEDMYRFPFPDREETLSTQTEPLSEAASEVSQGAEDGESENNEISLAEDEDDDWEWYDMEFLGKTIAAVLEKLRSDGQRVVVVGYSLGARIALYLATKYPHLVTDAVIVSGSPGLRTLAEREARARHDDSLAKELTRIGGPAFVKRWYDAPMWESLRGLPGFETFVEERVRSASDAPKGGLSAALRRLSTGRQPSLWEESTRYPGRILWVTGSKDAKFVDIAKEVEAAVANGSGEWTFEEIEECGHSLLVEATTSLGELLREWIGSAKTSEVATGQDGFDDGC